MPTAKYNFKLLCLFCAISWFVGCALSIELFYSSSTQNYYKQHQDHALIAPFSNDPDILNSKPIVRVIKIFIHNSIVSLIICVGGFLTAGFLSIVVLCFNGFMVTSVIINAAINNKGFSYIVNHLIWHGGFELFALIWFGGIGLSGFFGWKQFLKSSTIELTEYLSVKRLLTPIVLLAIAALIEGF